jgi:hypothetical protein
MPPGAQLLPAAALEALLLHVTSRSGTKRLPPVNGVTETIARSDTNLTRAIGPSLSFLWSRFFHFTFFLFFGFLVFVFVLFFFVLW